MTPALEQHHSVTVPLTAEESERRYFTHIVDAMSPLWIPHYVDCRENRARGNLRVGTDEYRTHLTTHQLTKAICLRLVVDVGHLRRTELSQTIGMLLNVQSRGRSVRIVPDPETQFLRLDTGTYLSIAIDPIPVLQAMVRELRQALSDDRLVACINATPGKRFPAMEV